MLETITEAEQIFFL